MSQGIPMDIIFLLEYFKQLQFSETEELFIKNIHKLSDQEEVNVIVCCDDFNPFKNLRSEMDEEQHFLFNHLKKIFAQKKNITMEFVYIWELMELLIPMASDNANIFVWNFTFNDRSDHEEMVGNIKSFTIPQVLKLVLLLLTKIFPTFQF